MNKKNKILITFDLEEFDLPVEYGQKISSAEMFSVASKGLEVVLNILKEFQIKATFFITAYYAENHLELIKQILEGGHEIASHMYYHSDYDEKYILLSKIKLEELTKTKINGIRMPRLQHVNLDKIQQAGYIYDSSLNPTYIPGRYNNLRKSRTMYTHRDTNLTILPFSTSIFRIPLFWLSFKNFIPSVYIFLCKMALKKDGYLHLYFHPWEFADISLYKIPFYIKRNSGEKMIKRFKYLLNRLMKNNDFIQITELISKRNL